MLIHFQKTSPNNNKYSWVCWYTPVIPMLRRLRQEDWELELDLGYTVHGQPVWKTNKQSNKHRIWLLITSTAHTTVQGISILSCVWITATASWTVMDIASNLVKLQTITNTVPRMNLLKHRTTPFLSSKPLDGSSF
jgi:hypothetical protein